jgi:hypothetical protein
VSKLIAATALLNSAAVLVLGAARQDWPAGFWTNRPAWTVAALIVTAVIPVWQYSLSERGERARRKALEREQKIEVFLAACLTYVVRNAGVDFEHTGIQAFVVRGRLRPKQVRLAKVRLGAVPTSGIVWYADKGVVGKCWMERAAQYEDLERHFAGCKHLSRLEWGQLPPSIRFGLTYEDFQRVKDKYSIVAAAPIIDRHDRYVGCLTVDTPQEPGSKGVSRAAILQSLATTAQLVSAALEA